ncbi:MAG: phosphoribosyl-AMP cyclohydrolase [Spirochaetota bacterium]
MVELDFEKGGGVIPAIVQDKETGDVLMMAFMNPEAWEVTRTTGYAHYWSRSRKKLWKKGEVSGNLQKVKEIRVDCDNDCVLLKVEQAGGAACHTGYRSCFYRVVDGESLKIAEKKVFNPEEKYGGKSKQG